MDKKYKIERRTFHTFQLERYEEEMSTEKRLILVESEKGVNIEEILSNNGAKVIENELIRGGIINRVDDFFANDLRQEYLLHYKWYQDPEEKRDSMYLEINEETYNRYG